MAVLKTIRQPFVVLEHAWQSEVLRALVVLLAASALEELDHVHLSVGTRCISRDLPSIVLG